MRAMVLSAFGAPLRLQTVPRPTVGPTDVLLRVRAAGVGLTVVIMTANPGRVTSFPRIPGHEVAGEVVEVGAEVSTVAVGERVVCHFYLTCGACRFCRSGRETLCTAFRGFVGQASDGGYAEYMALPARNVTPIPAGVSDVDAAIASDAIATPYHACREEARVGPGDTVLVVGAGMLRRVQLVVGDVDTHHPAAAQLGHLHAVDADAAAGADAVVDGRAGDLAAQVRALTGGRGVDAAIDFVASQETLEAALASLARAGRLVIIGSRPPAVFGVEATFRVDPGRMLYDMLEIHGSRYVTLTEIQQTLELLRLGRIRPVISRTFPLEGAEEAHELLRKNALIGRAALLVSSGP